MVLLHQLWSLWLLVLLTESNCWPARRTSSWRTSQCAGRTGSHQHCLDSKWLESICTKTTSVYLFKLLYLYLMHWISKILISFFPLPSSSSAVISCRVNRQKCPTAFPQSLVLWLPAVVHGVLLILWFVSNRKSLREAAERLADKYEDAKYRQEAIMNR